ncbi:hypothetical protein PYCC9005_005975 [Savitreella phatthalungensis]
MPAVASAQTQTQTQTPAGAMVHATPAKKARSISRQLMHVTPTSVTAPEGLKSSSNNTSLTKSHRRDFSLTSASDTTARTIDVDTRPVRMSRRSIFTAKPQIHLSSTAAYMRDPDGQLPTLGERSKTRKSGARSLFVDDLADDLTTSELARAMLRDDRRRKSRVKRLTGADPSLMIEGPNSPTSTMPRASGSGRNLVQYVSTDYGGPTGERIQEIDDSSPQVTPAGSRVKNQQVTGSRVKNQQVTGSRVKNQQVTTPEGTPVHDHYVKAGVGKGSRAKINAITGRTTDWQTPTSTTALSPFPADSAQREQLVVLAGNRDSFPDFATVDERKRAARQSAGSAFLSNAWTSLFKRAGSTRARKERDLEHHRKASLVKSPLGMDSNLDRTSTQDTEEVLRDLEAGALVAQDRREAAPIRFVESQPQILPPPARMQLAQTAHIERAIPEDAFYDPNLPRTNSVVATNVLPGTVIRPGHHSRNFSRPNNETVGTPGKLVVNPLIAPESSAIIDNTYEDIVNGTTYPLTPIIDAYNVAPAEAPLTVPPGARATTTPGGYATARDAALASLKPDASPVLPMSVEQARQANVVASRIPTAVALFPDSSDGGSSIAPQNAQVAPSTSSSAYPIDSPRPLPAHARLNKREGTPADTNSIHSLQSLDSIERTGGTPWLSNQKRQSEYDTIVHRSFSRLADARPSSVLSQARNSSRLGNAAEVGASTADSTPSKQQQKPLASQVVIPKDLAEEMAEIERDELLSSDEEAGFDRISKTYTHSTLATPRAAVFQARQPALPNGSTPADATQSIETGLDEDEDDEPALADIATSVGVWRNGVGRPVTIVQPPSQDKALPAAPYTLAPPLDGLANSRDVSVPGTPEPAVATTTATTFSAPGALHAAAAAALAAAAGPVRESPSYEGQLTVARHIEVQSAHLLLSQAFATPNGFFDAPRAGVLASRAGSIYDVLPTSPGQERTLPSSVDATTKRPIAFDASYKDATLRPPDTTTNTDTSVRESIVSNDSFVTADQGVGVMSRLGMRS